MVISKSTPIAPIPVLQDVSPWHPSLHLHPPLPSGGISAGNSMWESSVFFIIADIHKTVWRSAGVGSKGQGVKECVPVMRQGVRMLTQSSPIPPPAVKYRVDGVLLAYIDP